MRIMRVIVDRIDSARDLQELFALVIELSAVFVERSFNPVELIFDARAVIWFELCAGLSGG